ncbi:MAG: aminotransferase class I/II-fold pyridoxal phosphate-dependent enzyme [Pseudomonadota bacterium]
MTPPLDLRPLNPFFRLPRLLADITPGPSPRADGQPLDLGIGDPRTGMPALGLEAMQAASAGWSSYPPFQGHPDLLAAAAAWLTKVCDLPEGFIEKAGRVVPVSGSREGLFFLTQAALTAKRHRLSPDQRPVVLLPDPGYHVYAGAVLAADGDPYFVRVDAAGGHLPDFTQVPDEILARTAMACFCSPANPQGSAASAAQLEAALSLARERDFLLVSDECYGDLYFGERPAGGLSIAAASGSLGGLVTAHSLSKRSGAPGLRCGFLTGDSAILDAVEGLLRFGGAGMPLPVQRAAIALLGDEEHVAANRAFYGQLMGLAEQHLGKPFGWQAPDGGFFAWLDVSGTHCGDGETAAKHLWREAGIRTLPGAYMSLSMQGEAENPGRPYLRIALVDAPDLVESALARIAALLL